MDEACDPFSGYVMWAVGKYRHPESLAKKREESVEKALEKAGIRTGTISKAEIASKLVAYAKGAMSGCSPNDGEVDALMSAMSDVKRDMEALDEATEELIALAKELPHFAQILSIDGAGDALAALICAEIVEPSRFSCRNGLVAYAWLDPTILQSGRNDGLHYSITRKGNAFLRKYLYLAVENMAIHKASNAITEFYSKKKSIGLCHKAAATAACRKLLVCIWGMLRSGTFFDK